MRRLLATTAIVTLAAAPVMAETQAGTESGMQASETSSMSDKQSGKRVENNLSAKVNGMDVQASRMIGHPVYIRSEEASSQEIADTASTPADSWERVGEVDDIILSAAGEIEAVTLDAGGFLGMGEKNVRTGMDELKFVTSTSDDHAEGQEPFFIVFTGDRSMLEERDEMNEQSVRDMGQSFWSERAEKMQVGTGSYGQNAQAGRTAELDSTQRDALTADELQGLTVYGPGAESIGEISELIVSDNGEIDKVVVDVGGFLGLGEKPVAIGFEEVSLREAGGETMDTLRAMTEYTGEELEDMEAWEG